jgi:acyl-CoA reductase-like NAD-dependent aldehyde dehydrogenase
VPIFSWSTEEEVIARANYTKTGLCASVWSSDLTKAKNIGLQLETGSLWINNHVAPSPNFPFSGHKESGLGSEWGVAGLKGYTNTQTFYMKKHL